MRDVQRFDEFYRETSARVMRYGYALVGEAAEAQDVVQEAYARAWRDWRTVADHPAPEAWVRLTVARLATDRWRRLTGWRNAMSRSGPLPSVGPPSENTVLLTRALRQLPPNHRQAVALHYLYDMPVAQIGAEMGATENTVKSWLSRGRTALASLLTDPAAAPVLGVQ